MSVGQLRTISEAQALDDFGRGFVALQETLRRAVRRAIEVRAFAAVFEQDGSIEARFSIQED